MFNKYEKGFTLVLLVACAVVGIVGYSFSRSPSPPDKVWFDAVGGDVIFNHAYHVSLAECSDCHHNYEGEGSEANIEMNCRACHYWGEARDFESDDPTHSRFIGANCTQCHKEMGLGVSCDSCHVRQGYAFEASGRVMPAMPSSVRFEADAGEVNFNHKLHVSEDVGETCQSCHHEFKGGKGMEGMEHVKSCRACHYKLADNIPEYDNENHTRYIGASCAECHDPDDCSMCHTD